MLDVDAIIQSKSEEKSDRKQTDPETLPPTKIQNIGQSISFTNVYTTPETKKLRHNVVPAIKDNAIPERTPILNVCKVEAAAKAIEFGNMAVLALPASTATGGSVLGTLSSHVNKSVGSWALSDAAVSGMARLGGGLIAALWPSQLGDGTLDGSLQFNTSDAINTTVRFNLYKDENGTEQIVGIHSGDGYAYGERVAKKVAVRDGDKFVINLEEGITLTWVPDGEEYKLNPSTERPEYDGLDVHDIWVRPIEEHQQELGTALYPEEELVEYIVIFPADAGLPPLYLVYSKNITSRLPKHNGEWIEGEPGNGLWRSDIPPVNAITNGEAIPFKDGKPVFDKWSKGSLIYSEGLLDGTRADFKHVYNDIATSKGLKSTNAAKNLLREQKLTPHHNTVTEIQLVPTELHGNIPHIGSASHLRSLKK